MKSLTGTIHLNNSSTDKVELGDNKGDTMLLANQPKQLKLKSDQAIKTCWDKNCKDVPINSN